jgi:hypothetical protein
VRESGFCLVQPNSRRAAKAALISHLVQHFRSVADAHLLWKKLWIAFSSELKKTVNIHLPILRFFC